MSAKKQTTSKRHQIRQCQIHGETTHTIVTWQAGCGVPLLRCRKCFPGNDIMKAMQS